MINQLLEMSEPVIPEEDARGMLRLLAEVASSPGDHSQKKALLMDGLCRMISAKYWVWGLASNYDPEQPPVYTAMMSGGFSREQVPKFMLALDSKDLFEGTKQLGREVVEKGKQITRIPAEYDQTGFFETADTNHHWRDADISAGLISYRPVAHQSLSGIGIYRNYDAEPFNLRDSRIVHIVMEEVDWLHEQGWPWESALQVPDLPARCRMALNMLLEGLSRKEVADQMGVSIHTLNDYVKRIYEFFDVHSHAELINRFRTGR